MVKVYSCLTSILIALLTCSVSFGQTSTSSCDASCKCSTSKQTRIVLVSNSPNLTQVQTQFGIKSPVGHTHTCVNGHTWDHSITSSHNCPVCGQTQFVQDSVPKMVTVSAPVQTAPQYSLPVSGCANGSCPTAAYTQTRQGFFRR